MKRPWWRRVCPNTARRGESGGWGAVWLSVCLGGQFAKLKLQKTGRRTKLRLAWEISVSPLIERKKGRDSKQRENKMNKHPERPGCAPCLSSPCPWSSVSRNDGEPKWPRPPPLASLHVHPMRVPLSPKITCQSADEPISAAELTGHDGAVCPHSWIEQQQHTQSRSGEEKVPWWQPAVCPAWHGEPRSRTSTSRPSFLFRTAHSQFMHLYLR